MDANGKDIVGGSRDINKSRSIGIVGTLSADNETTIGLTLPPSLMELSLYVRAPDRSTASTSPIRDAASAAAAARVFPLFFSALSDPDRRASQQVPFFLSRARTTAITHYLMFTFAFRLCAAQLAQLQ